jgi:hypothetical protein
MDLQYGQAILNFIFGCVNKCPSGHPQKHFHFTEPELHQLGVPISLETSQQWDIVVRAIRQLLSNRRDLFMEDRYQPNAPTNLLEKKKMVSLTFTFREAIYTPIEGIDDEEPA